MYITDRSKLRNCKHVKSGKVRFRRCYYSVLAFNKNNNTSEIRCACSGVRQCFNKR